MSGILPPGVEPELTSARVQVLLELGILVTRWATGSRDLSRALNVLRKVYRPTNNGKFTEVKAFYQCSWCSNVLNVMPRFGTAPLLRHIQDCANRPENYVLPDQNLHVRNRVQVQPNAPHAVALANQQVAVIPSVSNLQSAAQNVAPPAEVSAEPNPAANQQVAAVPSVSNLQNVAQPAKVPAEPEPNPTANQESRPQPIEFVDVNAAKKVPNEQLIEDAIEQPKNEQNRMIPIAQLANLMAHANEIGAMYGRVTVEEFETILPNTSGQLPENFMDRAKAFAFARMGIKQPRVILHRERAFPEPQKPPPSKKSKPSANEATSNTARCVKQPRVELNRESKDPESPKPPPSKKSKPNTNDVKSNAMPVARRTRQASIAAKIAIKEMVEDNQQ